MKRVSIFFLKKTVRLSVIVAAVAGFSFTMVNLAPLDPITAYLGFDRMQISQAQEEQIVQRWGLDKPPLQRFFIWTTRVVTGDFGRSVIFNQPVIEVIAKRFSASLWLMALAWGISGICGFILGVVAGTYRGTFLDQAVRLYAYVLASTPAFWIGMLLLVIFAVQLGWLPFCCAGPLGVPPDQVTFAQRLRHLLLPAFTLSIIGVAQIAMHTREKMIDVFMSDYALFAFAQGESRIGVALRHGLRHTLLPAVTLQFATLGELFGGSVLAEQVFSYPGLGRTAVEAGVRGDVPLLLGIVLFSTLFVVAGNTTADLIYQIVDPRIRLGKGDHGADNHAG
jgi:peptide/nickel transport system permease protein